MPEPSDYDLLPAMRQRETSIRKRYRRAKGVRCWSWTGARTSNGYGTFSLRVDGRHRSVRAHRAVFMLALGRPIEQGMTLHHMCGNRGCVNPDHLLEMTLEQNQHRLRRGLSGRPMFDFSRG